MAYTAGQVVKAALQRILVQASEASLEADEYQDAFLALNAMMAAWSADGIMLGYTDVDSTDDEITVPPGAIRGIIANLAIEVSPDYNGNITQGLMKQAEAGMKTCRRLGVSVVPTQFGSNLPRGSGAGDFDSYIEDAYYAGADTGYTYYFEKDPDTVVPYTIDWRDTLNLSDSADTISTSTWSVESGDLTVDSDSETTTHATVVMSAGTAGEAYNLTNAIVTAGGYTHHRTVRVVCKEQ